MKNPKTIEDLFWTYFYQQFAPQVQKLWNKMSVDEYTGSFEIDVDNKFYVLYATPLRDDLDVNFIHWEFYDGQGFLVDYGKIDFPLKEWTMDPEKDAQRYIKVVKNFVETTIAKLIENPLDEFYKID